MSEAPRATLTATVDQLQAEVDGLHRELLCLGLAMAGMALVVLILMVRHV